MGRPKAFLNPRTWVAVLALGAGEAWAQNRSPQEHLDSYPLLEQELIIAGYTVQQWRAEADPQPQLVRLISPAGAITEFEDVRVTFRRHVGPGGTVVRAGDDLNGNGVPDLVLEGFSLGAHCCFRYRIYELGADLELLFAADTGDAALAFDDLDGDGLVELVTRDVSFAYAFCAFAFSPAPLVILAYRDGSYQVANDGFPAVHDAEIAASLARLVDAMVAGDGLEIETCAVLALALDHLYAGRVEAGWRVLEAFAPGGDPAGLRRELERILERSRWYPAVTGR